MVKRAFVREDGRWIEVGVYCPSCKGFWATLEASRDHRALAR
jgi:hypothetical protein